MFHHNCCEGLKFEMKNSGEELTVTIKGEKDKLALFEKKLNAMKTLCCDEHGNSCC